MRLACGMLIQIIRSFLDIYSLFYSLDSIFLLWEELAFAVYSAKELKIRANGYPLVESIVLTLDLSELGIS